MLTLAGIKVLSGQFLVLALDQDAITATYRAYAIYDVSCSTGRSEHHIDECTRAGFYTRKDFEYLLRVPKLTVLEGHILECLNIDDLNLGAATTTRRSGTLTADEVMLQSDPEGLQKHSDMAANAYERSKAYRAGHCVKDATRRTWVLSTDGSCVQGTNHGITAALAPSHTNLKTTHEREHADALLEGQSTLLEHLRKQPLSEQLIWVYWHHTADASWLGNWVLMQAIPHPISGLRDATVHEVFATCSSARPSARQRGAMRRGLTSVMWHDWQRVREYCTLTSNDLQSLDSARVVMGRGISLCISCAQLTRRLTPCPT